jgi:hypothetical protein
MAKKIDRSRVDAGRYELPKKLAFLQADKVDYVSLADKDGEFTVELSAGALSRLVKARAELKTIKSDHKTAAGEAAQALAAEKQAHDDTRAALAKAERRIKALEKKLATAAEPAQATAPQGKPAADAEATKPVKAARKGASKVGADVPDAAPKVKAPRKPQTAVAQAAKEAVHTTGAEEVMSGVLDVQGTGDVPVTVPAD